MPAVIVERARQPLVEPDPRRPAGQFAEAAVVGDEIADIDALALLGELAPLETAAAIDPHQRLGQREQRVRRLAADIERQPGRVRGQRGQQESLDGVVDIEQFAPLLAAPHLEGLAFQRAAQPDAEEILPRVLDPHPRPVDVGQPQRAGVDARTRRGTADDRPRRPSC